ncbi:MAG: hypothetical protein ACF788_02370 [Novipirellula sp. JB048]
MTIRQDALGTSFFGSGGRSARPCGRVVVAVWLIDEDFMAWYLHCDGVPFNEWNSRSIQSFAQASDADLE